MSNDVLKELADDLRYVQCNSNDFDTYEMQAWWLSEECGWHKPKVATWKDRKSQNDYTWLECSNCGYLAEDYKVLEIGNGTNGTLGEIIGYKWHACPRCAARMIFPKEDK